jgi:predicted HicB family RNase H-like nuclease
MARRVGRPARTGNRAMDGRLQIRVTPDELASYGKAADAAGIDRSTWIREILNAAVKSQQGDS